MTLTEFLAWIILLCRRHNASVTSWIRSPKRNAIVGGLPESRHLDGCAVDVVPDNPASYPAIAAEARAAGLDVLVHKGHAHIELDRRNHVPG